MKRVLIIEDDTKLQKLYAEALTPRGLEVLSVVNANQATIAIQQAAPDLIVLDIMLPGGKNGFDFLEEVRKDPKLVATKVLVVTALDSEKKTAETMGVAGYIVKPHSSMTEIVDKIVELTS